MILYPAIDLLDGRVVRLLHGDYNQVTVYAEDPVAMARKMKSEGASWLHIVDLNAARDGGKENLKLISRMAQESGLKIQNGGGIRDMASLEERLEAGVDRAVLGTAAIESPDFLAQALERFGGQIAVGMDCLGDEVRTHGWTRGGGVSRTELMRKLASLGAKTVIYTDISKDGALTGPSFANTEELIQTSGPDIILSGGVSSEEDIKKAMQISAAGVIIGRAYYEGRIDLARCINLYEKGVQDE